jgi:hypothetical protein
LSDKIEPTIQNLIPYTQQLVSSLSATFPGKPDIEALTGRVNAAIRENNFDDALTIFSEFGKASDDPLVLAELEKLRDQVKSMAIRYLYLYARE